MKDWDLTINAAFIVLDICRLKNLFILEFDTNIYVENLSHEVTEEDLKTYFEAYRDVAKVKNYQRYV